MTLRTLEASTPSPKVERRRRLSRSRTPPRSRAKLLERSLTSNRPGRSPLDAFLGRMPTYRLLDVESCLAQFCAERDVPTNVAVLACGPGSELDAVCQHFSTPVRSALALDACDWSSHAKAPVVFRRLDLRSDREEVLDMLNDDSLFSTDARLLVIFSSVATDTCSDLICDYVSKLPPHADALLLEPLGRQALFPKADDCASSAQEDPLVSAEVEWRHLGFNVSYGGPRMKARFCSRSSVH
eukprot:TRINITY_DN17049_c0_g1_i1.p1 TRINITY_DN17049_c0_g1~~TRINITY_DN17049_c0_g1_i1.p1  ORF type:complete len:241 (+),score=31.40 TRINITY_DN17049_c0_g1_i1:110-832(+)